MTRNFGVAFFFLALSLGCRKKEVAPPPVVAGPPASTPVVEPLVAEPGPHNMIRLDKPVVVNSGPNQTGGHAVAADETAQRAKLAQRATDQQASAPKVAAVAEVAEEKTAKPAPAEPTAAKTRSAPTRKSRHKGGGGTAVAAALKPVSGSPAAAAAPAEAASAHATLNFKNDAGGDFKLVDARFLMDGADLPNAITSAERGKTYQVFSGDIGAGQHQVTARLTYQGATHGVFTYMNGYSFKVRSEEVVNLPTGGNTTFTIICNEKKGLNQPIDKRLVVSLVEH